jgi:hypothetical protein
LLDDALTSAFSVYRAVVAVVCGAATVVSAAANGTAETEIPRVVAKNKFHLIFAFIVSASHT